MSDTGYLLTIELRRGDPASGEVGEIVGLSQAWCHDINAVIHEFGGTHLTGHRFKGALDALESGNIEQATDREIAADPRDHD